MVIGSLGLIPYTLKISFLIFSKEIFGYLKKSLFSKKIKQETKQEKKQETKNIKYQKAERFNESVEYKKLLVQVFDDVNVNVFY